MNKHTQTVKTGLASLCDGCGAKKRANRKAKKAQQISNHQERAAHNQQHRMRKVKG